MDGLLLHDRVVLVSGGTQGVGAGVARAAVRECARVETGCRPEVGYARAAELGAYYVRADVADVDGAQASVAAAVERFRRLD